MNDTVPVQCNICGSETFLPGPGGRMARSGKLPCCAGCGSLERHRGLRALLAGLPPAFFAARRAVLFAPARAPDGSLDPAWFASLAEYPTLDSAALPDASADFISFSHMLEFEDADQAAFADLLRVLSPSGILHISFASSLQNPATTRFDPPKPPYGRRWDYGQDYAIRFELTRRGLHQLVVQLHDPATGTSEPTHFFAKRAEDAAFLAASFKTGETG